MYVLITSNEKQTNKQTKTCFFNIYKKKDYLIIGKNLQKVDSLSLHVDPCHEIYRVDEAMLYLSINILKNYDFSE